MLQADESTVDVWDVDVPTCAHFDADDFRSALSQDEFRRAERFRYAPDRHRYCAARLLLRTLLARYTKRRAQDMRFAYSRHGKPRLIRDAPHRDVRFNVSHSRSRILFAFAHDVDVGVDIEHVQQGMFDIEVARSHFTDPEFALLMRSAEHRQQSIFFDIWVRKEAVAKAAGLGLSLDLKTFDVLPAVSPEATAAAVIRLRTKARTQDFHLQQLDVGSGFAAAFAVAGDAACRVRHIRADADDIMRSGGPDSAWAKGAPCGAPSDAGKGAQDRGKL